MLLSDELNITKLLKEEGQDILRFSNMVAQVTTKYGAIEVFLQLKMLQLN